MRYHTLDLVSKSQFATQRNATKFNAPDKMVRL